MILETLIHTHHKCGLEPWFGKIPWRRKWQAWYSCLENLKDRGTWQATVYGAKESDMTEQLNHPHGLPRWY